MMRRLMALGLVIACVLASSALADDAKFSGELRKWHRVTLTFDGPSTSETADSNPFLNYRLTVTFSGPGDATFRVPGYFAADGDAADSGADSGNKWRVHFTPNRTGRWRWTASFRTGSKVALSTDPDAGKPAAFDGARGEFTVKSSQKKGRDFRARGRLNYVGRRYLQFAETGEYYLKGGADSPENFLAYYEFDQTPDTHHYKPHAKHFRSGDPTWDGGKGKNIVGALNYLAGKGMNSVYALTMNVKGDGKDVWPWTSRDERFRFDCSKLAQWEIVFSHMEHSGLLLHAITQETENDQLLDGGALGPERKLYYRELIARFGHHLGLVWNLGEENTNTDKQRKQFARYIRGLDPYDHPMVVHTYPPQKDKVYKPLLGFPMLEGPSLQMGNMTKTHSETIKWLDRSAETEKQWVVCLDEIGPAHTGVKPDKDDPDHDKVRKEPLWGNLMAGGGGCEWYFGYKFAHNDLNCEDWTSRANMWDQTRYALEFFHTHLPYPEMHHADGLTDAKNDYCFARPGEVYAVYLPEGGTTKLDLGKSKGTFSVRWYDPRNGGKLQQGSVKSIKGPGKKTLGKAPRHADEDWAVLVKRAN